jgi:hypothetical protein
MKKITIIISTLFLLMIWGCNNDFEELNTNPDTTSKPNASMLCTNVILSVTKFEGRDATAYATAAALPKYIGMAGYINSSQYNYIGQSSFNNMSILPNIDEMNGAAENSPMKTSYEAVGKFARALMFYKLTMEMGDIPYTEANQAQKGNFKPKYDSQESVLIGVLNDLQTADALFANGETFKGDPTPYAGDPAKWRKVANSFALKVIMTLSKKSGVASLNLKNRFAAIVAAGNILEESTGFYGLNYSSVDRHPLYSTDNDLTGYTIVSSLMVDELKKLNDNRLFYFAEPTVEKTLAGVAETDPAAYVGVDVSLDYNTLNTNHFAGKYSIINLRYQVEEASEPLRLLTYAEQELILSEAVILGWIPGDAKTYYENGVKSALKDVMDTKTSHNHGMPIDATYIANYFTGEAAFKATTSEQLKQIWMQRYLLNFLQQVETSWFDYRRNNYPDFPIDPNTSMNAQKKTAVPVRYLYPGSEVSYNRENLTTAVNSQYDGIDEINKVMWILK